MIINKTSFDKILLKIIPRWMPAVIWMLSIFVMSSLPGADFSSDNETNFWIRKTLHIVEYSILCFCLFRATKNTLKSVVIAVFYAALDEFHQALVPSRTGKISDFLIDSSGILVTGSILWRYLQDLPTKLKNWLLE